MKPVFSPLGTCRKGDAVLFNFDGGAKAGIVHMNYEFEHAPVTLLTIYDFVTKDSVSGYSVWRETDVSKLVETKHIIDVLIYNKMSGSRLGVLLPIQCR